MTVRTYGLEFAYCSGAALLWLLRSRYHRAHLLVGLDLAGDRTKLLINCVVVAS
jgi:hypothetical protein